LNTHPASLVALYLGGTDLIGHRFWRYMEPEHYFYPISAKAIENFRNMIPDYYRAMDRLLGDLLGKMDRDCTVIILSDHGMHPAFLKKPDSRQNSAHHEDGPPGVLIAAGPGIARSEYPVPQGRTFPPKEAIPSLGKVADITPTILYLYDLPAALDMDGSIMTQLFKKEWLETHKPAYGSSYESGPSTSQNGEDYSTPMDRELLNRLRDLGYIQ
jgi:predicted AlkP superfamily phosphohydrolase/phosphomutase